MGSVAQAVVEFDEAVQAPWRPPLAGAGRRGQLRAVPDLARPSVAARTGAGRAPTGVAAEGLRTRPGAPRRPAPAGGTATHRATADLALRAAVLPVVPALRLTRRARRLGVVLGLAVGVVVGSWVGSAMAGDEGGLRLAGESSVVVEQGDTLWSIAAVVAGDGKDVRAVVAEIEELNGLSDSSLVPGQVLVLP